MPDDAEREFIQALVDECLKGYDDLPPALRARIRDTLEDYFSLHPEGKRLIRRAMPDPIVHGSGDVAVGPDASEAPGVPAARKGTPRSA